MEFVPGGQSFPERASENHRIGPREGDLRKVSSDHLLMSLPCARVGGNSSASGLERTRNRSSFVANGNNHGSHGRSVNSRDEEERNNFVDDASRPPRNGFYGIVNSLPRKGPGGRQNQRPSGPPRGYVSSTAIKIQGGQGSSSKKPSGSGATPPGSRKGQGFNANHLLNFQYDPIPRPPPRAAPARRHRKTQPFNKELFLQANFRFLVSDLGDYLLNTSDPDKMLQWEDVAAVNVAAPLPVQCPICLEDPPLCPQITTCGHIFCFPCILRYLLMGDFEVRVDIWKKCPLCFAMISCKELRTVFIDNVELRKVGDCVSFTLLVRSKVSIIPTERTRMTAGGAIAHSGDGQCDAFSKFTLTSDAEITTRRAVEELRAWAHRTEMEGGEDLEVLRYVLLCVDKLEERKGAWSEHRAMEFLSSSPPVRQRIMAQSKGGAVNLLGNSASQTKSAAAKSEVKEGEQVFESKLEADKVGNVVAETQAAMAELKERAGWIYESAFSDDEHEDGINGKDTRQDVVRAIHSGEKADGKAVESWDEAPEDADSEASNTDEITEKKEQNLNPDNEEREFYSFYQSADGQTLFLHPINIKCLLHQYGSYDSFPERLEAHIVELETITQSESTRKRYRYLSHLPLTSVFQLCEVDLSNILPTTAFSPFAEEIRSREQRRRRIVKQEKELKDLEERQAAADASRFTRPAIYDLSDFATLQAEDEVSNVDLEESLTNSSVTSSPSEVDNRRLFSRVAKLGFAAGYDAPDLGGERNAASASSSSSIPLPRPPGTPSPQTPVPSKSRTVVR